MNFIYIASIIVLAAFVVSIHQHFVLHRHVKTKTVYRLHLAAMFASAYIFIQLYNTAVFLTAATALTTVVTLLHYCRNKYCTPAADTALITETSKDMWLFLIVLWAFRTLIYDYSPVPSGSMEPTLLAGDLVAINKTAYQIKIPPFDKPLYKFSNPKRGDIVVFNSPIEPQKFYIKRVIAVGGDHVTYKGKQYFVNGEALPQSEHTLNFTANNAWLATATENIDGIPHEIQLDNRQFTNTIDVDVPPGHYFVSGDNRDFSIDSRIFGPISEDKIVGKASHIITHFTLPTILNFSRTGKLT